MKLVRHVGWSETYTTHREHMFRVPFWIAIVQHDQERECYIGRELEHLEIRATHCAGFVLVKVCFVLLGGLVNESAKAGSKVSRRPP